MVEPIPSFNCYDYDWGFNENGKYLRAERVAGNPELFMDGCPFCNTPLIELEIHTNDYGGTNPSTHSVNIVAACWCLKKFGYAGVLQMESRGVMELL